MAIIVEHDKRKHEILEKSIELFSKEGYEDVTFQKIADACGITRTTLYIYFKNKKEIFTGAIKQMTSELEKDLVAIIKDAQNNAETCLRKIVESIVKNCVSNKKLLQVILMYLIGVQKSGSDPEERIHRRVLRADHLIVTVVLKGQKSGEFKMLPAKHIKDAFFKLFEATIFEACLYNNNNLEELVSTFHLFIDGILNK